MKCLHCETEFEAQRSTAKYCSNDCRKQAFKIVDPDIPVIEINKEPEIFSKIFKKTEIVETPRQEMRRQNSELNDLYLKNAPYGC